MTDPRAEGSTSGARPKDSFGCVQDGHASSAHDLSNTHMLTFEKTVPQQAQPLERSGKQFVPSGPSIILLLARQLLDAGTAHPGEV